MKLSINIISIYCLLFLFTGCSTNKVTNTELIVLPKAQQDAYLSRSKPAKYFGYSVFGQPNGAVGLKGEARLHPNHKAIAGMINNMPLIPISGRNQSFKSFAILDTGSPISWMEFKYAQDLNADFLAYRERNIPYQGIYNIGEVDAYAAVVHQLRIDQLFIENIPLYVKMAIGSLGPQARGIKNPPLSSVIGYDILKLFSVVQFDFDAGIIRLASTQTYTPNEALLVGSSSIIDKEGLGLVVEGSIFGESTPVVLDFAGNYHLTTPNAMYPFTRQLSIGDLVFRKVPTERFDNIPRVGNKLFSDLIVTICPKEKIVYFERSR